MKQWFSDVRPKVAQDGVPEGKHQGRPYSPHS